MADRLLAQIRRAAKISAATRAFSEYERTGRPEALDAAVAAIRDVVASTPTGHPDLPIYLSSLAAALHTRFELVGNGADLAATIDARH